MPKNPITSSERRGLVAVAILALLFGGAGAAWRACGRHASHLPGTPGPTTTVEILPSDSSNSSNCSYSSDPRPHPKKRARRKSRTRTTTPPPRRDMLSDTIPQQN